MGDAAAPGRQRPEEILAQTLTPALHPEATDGWSSRGRRVFLIAMAAAGVVLVVAGLLLTRGLAPGQGRPAPVQTGPGGGLTNQLLQSSGGDQTPATPSDSTPLGLPLPATPTTTRSRTGTLSPTPVPGDVSTPNNVASSNGTTATSGPPPSPTTTVPCSGLLGQGLQATQIPLPCGAPTNSPVGGSSKSSLP